MSWAMNQPVTPAITKFVLVTMAECVNAAGGTMECWPSYAHLARRTGANTKTVEASIYRLREDRYIVDTGKREGGTGKVVVYRLNDPVNGVITQGPRGAAESKDASAARAQTTPLLGALATEVIPPNLTGNPPKLGGQSPQKVGVTTPKTGDVIRNGSRKEPGKESGFDAAVAALPEVDSDTLRDWLPVRKDKHAGPVTNTVAKALRREAEKAGLTPSEAVTYCCEAGWQNFNAGFYAKREGAAPAKAAATKGGRHAGFAAKNYHEGVAEDGSLV